MSQRTANKTLDRMTRSAASLALQFGHPWRALPHRSALRSTAPLATMKSFNSIFVISSIFLFLALPCFARTDSIDVTPKNQKELGLDFSVAVRKHKLTFIVDFVIPSDSTLESFTTISVFSPQDDFSAPTGLSIPFMGLTRFPRDSESTPKQVEWVRGVRLWVGEASIAGVTIQFEYRDKLYRIRLADYAPK